ncbi:hypothetical protein [Echinicola vietnamensis]|uniref:Sugar transporter n=1 Tax=Echinicola vietnamensis (strain DSM 17526 / LMG 23754 / KMM 6221) TaxID=926556 RepID=L0FTC5_ECHVK|nr:hypothetical protein [Echinicola vietnamensis]AGA77159.1 hypothetical protein Echvi_0886 [Echinicola vietnamensis DSM 17526]
MTKVSIPIWFWAVTGTLLLWNLLGVGSFFMHVSMTEEAIAALPKTEQELYAVYPTWALVAFAVAVFGGVLGCIGLLLRKKWAKYILILSLIGIIIQMFHSLIIARAMEVYGPGAVVMPIMVIVIAVFLVWMANFSVKRGWLT